MPAKYHIKTSPAPPRHKPVGKYGIIDWREDCSACHNCVKRECAYSVYNDERDRLLENVEYVDYLYECKGCLCCVQSCTKGLLSWQINPAYLALGDEIWTADIITSTWYQAETGKVPVSGAGYPGPFRGPGFDSILTDMSEIVRPTRDGIHGREYISTSVDIGRKPLKLSFNQNGSVETDCPPLVEIPLPILFNLMPWHDLSPNITLAILDAASRLETLAITDEVDLLGNTTAVPHIETQSKCADAHNLIEWANSPNALELISRAKSTNPDLVAIVKLPLGSAYIERAIELARGGADVIHAFADWHGVVNESGKARHITDAIRELHQAFVRAGIRDAVTLIASGGISMAEHVIKTILCGADLVAIDIPLMVALECRVCMNCQEGLKCPANFHDIEHNYAVQRIVNLMGAWHSQMLEMMGAMGIREARRLRGEVGRAMFFDDLERECFGPVFGKLKAWAEVS
ncbi:MAG: glutamate synthase-related protein [Armatimonadota bacterium]|nr:glutamate synthase-related protein [Armatimonadota bacterium]